MRKARSRLLACCLLLSPALWAEQPSGRQVLAVLDFTSSNTPKADLEILVDYMSSHVVASDLCRVIDRAQRNPLLSEIQFSQGDCTDEACQLEIGRMLSANYVVVGSLGRVSNRYILNAKLIDVETSETVRAESRKYDTMDALVDQSEDLVKSLLGFAPGQAAPGTGSTTASPVASQPATGSSAEPAAVGLAAATIAPLPVEFHKQTGLFGRPYCTYGSLTLQPDLWGGFPNLADAIEKDPSVPPAAVKIARASDGERALLQRPRQHRSLALPGGRPCHK